MRVSNSQRGSEQVRQEVTGGRLTRSSPTKKAFPLTVTGWRAAEAVPMRVAAAKERNPRIVDGVGIRLRKKS